MTSSEVLILQRELHALAKQNREDHKLVREALGKLQDDLDSLSDRLHDVEDTDKQIAAVEKDREQRRTKTLGIVGAIAASAGVISGILVAAIDRI
jgi:septal ring factor EnvC (AmiA/AmiB activator)